jgi:hypothetical protein
MQAKMILEDIDAEQAGRLPAVVTSDLFGRIESYGFTCEAGPLELCTEYQQGKREIAEILSMVMEIGPQCSLGYIAKIQAKARKVISLPNNGDVGHSP